MSYLSLSTWSLHRLLGPLRWTTWEETSGTHGLEEQYQPQELTLLELPGEAASRGYRAIEVCHFHFPSTEEAYLVRLKEACNAAGISFDTLLLDYGDLSSANEKRRTADIAFVRDWIDIAALCGAKRIRVIGGDAPPRGSDSARPVCRRVVGASRLCRFRRGSRRHGKFQAAAFDRKQLHDAA